MAKAERALAFHWTLMGQGIVRLTSQLADELESFEEMLLAGALAAFIIV